MSIFLIAALCMCTLLLAACKNDTKNSSASGDGSSDVTEGGFETESKKEYSAGELYKIRDLLFKHYKELHLLSADVNENKGKVVVKVESDFAQNFYGLTDGLCIDREALEVTTSNGDDVVLV